MENVEQNTKMQECLSIKSRTSSYQYHPNGDFCLFYSPAFRAAIRRSLLQSALAAVAAVTITNEKRKFLQLEMGICKFLSRKFSHFFTFILGGQFLLPQRANNGKRAFTQLLNWMR